MTKIPVSKDSLERVARKAKSYTDSKVSALGAALKYKGSVADYAALQAVANPDTGDTYNVVAANGNTPGGTNYAWNGTAWDALGGDVDLSDYAKTADVAAAYVGKEDGKGLSTNDYDGAAKAKVDAIPDNPVYTDTTYESKAAADGGTDVSLVTTGEKASWNAALHESDIEDVTQATIDGWFTDAE